MNKRHVFATNDINAAKAVVRAAREHGIPRRCIVVEARKDIEIHRISDERKNVSMDFIPAALRGTLLGALSGLLLGIVAHWVPYFGIGWGGVFALAGLGALIGTWASVLMGSALPDEVRRTFDRQIEAGQILVVIDADEQEFATLEPALSRAGGVRLPYEATTALS
jgi:uncharacterized membrane protein